MENYKFDFLKKKNIIKHCGERRKGTPRMESITCTYTLTEAQENVCFE